MLKKTLIILAVLAIVALYFVWQSNDLTVSRYTYQNKKITGALDGYKICQISDLHNKLFGKNQRRLLRHISREQPDLIVITGDIIDDYNTNVAKALELTDRLASIAPVYYVTGNHELGAKPEAFDALLEGLERGGVTVLRDAVREISIGGESLYLIGLDDPSRLDGTLARLVSDLGGGELQILLVHRPENFELYAAAGVDLVFAGHAHGGQVRLPFVGGLYAPGQGFFPEYTCGMYTYGQATMVVSRGLGNSLPGRVNNRPDLVVVTLESAGRD
jgi:predicted MPP superfamily phosphohydrolase